MRPFVYERPEGVAGAVRAAASRSDARIPPTEADAQFIAGGTLILDLMKLDTMRPRILIDIGALRATHGSIEVMNDGLRLGALVRMSEAAAHPMVQQQYPVIAQSLQLAASAQIRNMATLAGNVLQRTRCQYFRDPSWSACNKRVPGSGCAALNGVNRTHAVLGISEQCIATYPGDFAQALMALDAAVQTLGPDGARMLPFERLHTGAEVPNRETVLAPGEVIVGFVVPGGPWTRRSLYLKVRDRESYEFALASAAVALDMAEGRVREARIALGGVAYRPWRARDAEAVLVGHPLDEQMAQTAADAAFAGAMTRQGNGYKPELGRRTLVRALLAASRMEI
jgi:xanthine dehydrogenase YagS FAD-binding subunit